LTLRAREVVTHLCRATDLPVMGVGGVMTADDAQALLEAGARLVQLYTGFIYAGPALIGAINRLERA
jgi:dihydroorotate dehydrogenase